MNAKNVIAAGAVAISAVSAANAAPVLWDTEDGGNGHYYEVVYDTVDVATALSNAAASTYEGLSGYLVTITSQEEQDFLTSLVAACTQYWIAASDAETEGEWKWIAGPEAGELISGYANWMPGEPNDYMGREDYAVANRTNIGQWNDLPGWAKRAYVVEYSRMPSGSAAAVPLPAGLPLAFGALAMLGAAARRRKKA